MFQIVLIVRYLIQGFKVAFGRMQNSLNFTQSHRSAALRKNAMKNLYYREKAPVIGMVTAIAEGLWNGIVVSGVLTVTALLIKSITTLYFH
jgi:hypothetical protein